jgi:L-threonylcarbamoyladenylate synthase
MMPAERISLTALFSHKGPRDPMRQLVQRVKDGAIFVYPTETIYGIGGIVSPQVEQRILDAKQRPQSNQMLLIAAQAKAFLDLGLYFGPAAEALARAFWPGRLTLVLKNSRGGTTGVRVSNHPFLLALAKHYNMPIYSTSANISSQPYVNDPDAIYRNFCTRVDFMIDAGTLPPSLPSTVVKIEDDGSFDILRSGAVSEAEICAAVGSPAAQTAGERL